MGGSAGVEGWLVGTRVVTGNAACGGGDEGTEAGAMASARGTAVRVQRGWQQGGAHLW